MNKPRLKSLAIPAAMFGVVILSGCVSDQAPKPLPPPTADDIKSGVSEINKLAAIRGADNNQAPPTTLAIVGYDLADNNCQKFFDAVLQKTNDAAFNRKEVTLVGAATAAALSALHNTPQTIGILSLATGLTADSIDNYQQYALFTANPVQVHKLVISAQQAYRASADPTDASKMTDPVKVAYYIAGYSSICSYSNIEQMIADAISTAKPTDTNTVTTTMFSVSDQIQLAAVNSLLNQSTNLLSDSQYVELYWFLKTGITAPSSVTLATKDLGNFISIIYDSTASKLTATGAKVAQLMDVINSSNKAFQAAVAAFGTAHPPPTTPPPTVFTTSDQTTLANVNTLLNISKTLLSDDQYTEIYWFLTVGQNSSSGVTLAGTDLENVFSAIYDTGKVTDVGDQVAKAMLPIYTNNASFQAKVAAFTKAHPAGQTAPAALFSAPTSLDIAGQPAQPTPPPVPAPTPVRRPNIQITH